MVRIGKTITELKIEAVRFFDKSERLLGLSRRLDTKLALPTLTNEERLFYQELRVNIKEIITELPEQLETRILIIKPLYEAIRDYRIAHHTPQPPTAQQKKTISKDLKNEVLNIFGYGEFTNYDDGKWAYSHAGRLSISVCPYCNMQYTFTIKTARGKTRPQFDHFMNKAKHPYFSLSFFNLVPSCYNCNASFKGSKEFYYKSHIHPFIEGTQETLVFRTDIKKVDYLFGKKGFEIQLKPAKGAKNKNLKRASRSCKVFHIKEQYKFHHDYAGGVISKAYMYNDTKIKELMNGFNHIFKDEKEILETLFGNYISEDKLHERVLSKLTHDLLNEVGVKIPS